MVFVGEKNEKDYSIHYLQAILTSKVLDFYLRQISSPFRGGYWSYGKRFIKQLPVHTIDFNNPEDINHHDEIVAFVENMLMLNKKLAIASIPSEKTQYQRQIDATDRQIDQLVYQLYDLSDEEINIVETNCT